MLYIKIGIRNLIKNFKKSIITIITIAFSLSALLVYEGITQNMFKMFEYYVIHYQYGHFQIYCNGYSKYGKIYPYKYIISDYKKISSKIESMKEVSFVTPRLYFNGILANDDRSFIISGYGGEIENEKKMMSNTLIEHKPSSGDPAPVIIGENLLKKFSAKPEDEFTMIANMKGGGINGIDVAIEGIKKGMGEIDEMNKIFLLAPIEKIQFLLNISNSTESLIVMLKTDKKSDYEKVKKKLVEICHNYNLELKEWRELATFYERAKDMYKGNQRVLSIVIFIVSIFIIANTFFRNFLERTREIGTIRAIGTRKIQIVYMFLSEGFWLSFSGILAGIVLTLFISFIIRLCGGIYNPPTVFNSEAFYTMVDFSFVNFLKYALLFLIASIVSSLVVSRKASNIDIAEALRWF